MQIRDREQQKSKLVRVGEGIPHIKAKIRLINILIKSGWEVHSDASLHITSVLRSGQHNRLWDDDYYHEFDIYAKKKHDNGLVSEICLEIDGSSHNSKTQQGKDKTAEEYARFFLKDARFYRVPISMLIGKYKETDEYLAAFYDL